MCFYQFRISTLGQGFCILYRLSAVNAVCREQRTAVVGCHNDYPMLTITHHVNPPFKADGYHVVSLLQKNVSLASGTNKSKRMSLIV